MTKGKSFVNSFVAFIKGDDAEVQAQRAWRSAKAALEVETAGMTGKRVQLEADVDTANDKLADARVNNGNKISELSDYVDQLVDAKNNLASAEELLEDHDTRFDFLKSELAALTAEETEA